MRIGGDLDGDAIATGLAKATVAFPVSSGRFEVGVARNFKGHAGLIGLAETAFALPTASER